ncbi:single-stranded DNA-binding protein [Lactococcus petauri]
MLNKVQLIGRLGADPELKYSPTGDAIASFSLATTEKWKDKNGESQEKTEWHRCSAFAKPAEILCQYLKKGSIVYIEGKLTTKMVEKDGDKRYFTNVIVKEFKFLPNGQGGQGNNSSQGDDYSPQSNPDFAADDIPF